MASLLSSDQTKTADPEQRTKYPLQPSLSSLAHRARVKRYNLSSVSLSTERGYSTGMGIFLAYSGMEALATAMGQRADRWEAEDKQLAKNLNRLLNGLVLRHPDQKEAINWLLDNHQQINRYGTSKKNEITTSF